MNDLKKISLKLQNFGFSVIGVTKPLIDKEVIENYNLFKKKFQGDMYWLEYHESLKKIQLRYGKKLKLL